MILAGPFFGSAFLDIVMAWRYEDAEDEDLDVLVFGTPIGSALV